MLPALLGNRRPAQTRPSMASNIRTFPRRLPALLGAVQGVERQELEQEPAYLGLSRF